MDTTRKNNTKRLVLIIAATALFMWALLYAPTPFVIYEPGLAALTKPMVSIGSDEDKQGSSNETASAEGAFLLTTIQLSDTNLWRAIASSWDSNKDIYNKKDIFRGYSEQEYMDRSTVIMLGSQNNAIEAAYRYMKVAYQHNPESVAVSDSIGSNNELQAGDTIVSVEDTETIRSLEDMVRALSHKQTGDSAAIVVERNGAPIEIVVTLGEFEGILNKEQLKSAFAGIVWSELQSLQPDDSSLRLSINAGVIGGPSAGLMFALQSIDLLNEKELTEGMRVAGTGTIEPDGTVGAIGGIAYKIVAADAAGAQLFLAPTANYKEAAKKAAAIGSKMRVLSVATLNEAVAAVAEQATSNTSK
ncbi:MAG: PDZ domain-containing protein [Candidatus Pristimantibacillus sp.]